MPAKLSHLCCGESVFQEKHIVADAVLNVKPNSIWRCRVLSSRKKRIANGTYWKEDSPRKVPTVTGFLFCIILLCKYGNKCGDDKCILLVTEKIMLQQVLAAHQPSNRERRKKKKEVYQSLEACLLRYVCHALEHATCRPPAHNPISQRQWNELTHSELDTMCRSKHLRRRKPEVPPHESADQ